MARIPAHIVAWAKAWSSMRRPTLIEVEMDDGQAALPAVGHLCVGWVPPRDSGRQRVGVQHAPDRLVADPAIVNVAAGYLRQLKREYHL